MSEHLSTFTIDVKYLKVFVKNFKRCWLLQASFLCMINHILVSLIKSKNKKIFRFYWKSIHKLSKLSWTGKKSYSLSLSMKLWKLSIQNWYNFIGI